MALLELLILEEEFLLVDGFNFVLSLIDLDYFVLSLFLKRLIFADLLHVGYLISSNNLVHSPMFPEFVHGLQHIILQTESRVAFAIEINLYYQAIFVDIDPPDIAILQVNLVVETQIDVLLQKGEPCGIDQMKLVLEVRKSFQHENSVLLDQASLSLL